MSSSIDPSISVIGYFSESYVRNAMVRDTDSFATKAAKCTVGAVANCILSTALLTEAVVRGALGVIAKGIHLFLPPAVTEGFKEHVVEPFLLGSLVSGTLSTFVASFVLSYFLGNQVLEAVGNKILGKGEETSHQLRPFINYTFFAGSNLSDPVISS